MMSVIARSLNALVFPENTHLFKYLDSHQRCTLPLTVCWRPLENGIECWTFLDYLLQYRFQLPGFSWNGKFWHKIRLKYWKQFQPLGTLRLFISFIRLPYDPLYILPQSSGDFDPKPYPELPEHPNEVRRLYMPKTIFTPPPVNARQVSSDFNQIRENISWPDLHFVGDSRIFSVTWFIITLDLWCMIGL